MTFLCGISTEHTGQATSLSATLFCAGCALSEALGLSEFFPEAEVVCVDVGIIRLGAGGPRDSVVRVGVDARAVVMGDLDLDGVCARDTKCLPLNASVSLKCENPSPNTLPKTQIHAVRLIWDRD